MRSRSSEEEEEEEERKCDILLQGIKAAWPICVGFLSLGFAFGVLAQKAGLELLDIALMSMLVYAGSSQFISPYMASSQLGSKHPHNQVDRYQLGSSLFLM
jgi:predicted branched-subunit amino acid permease